jgi:hypothetical protein
MGLFDLFGKKQVEPIAPFTLRAEFHPYRLPANKADFVDLEITVGNNTDAQVLSSVVVVVPKGLGFEQSAMSQQKELRLGYMEPRDQKSFKIRVYGTARTPKGLYPVKLYTFSHYKDYGHVLNEARRSLQLRVD